MKYMVTCKYEGSALSPLDDEELTYVKQKIQDAMGSGRVLGAYAFVGGGSLWIVDSESNATLARGLRKLGVFNAEVTPLIEVVDLIDAYAQSKSQATESSMEPAGRRR